MIVCVLPLPVSSENSDLQNFWRRAMCKCTE